MAQSIAPAGGGTVSTSSGNISGGGASQGVLVQQTGSGGVTVSGVDINNTTGSPTLDGLQVNGNGSVGAGVSIAGSSTINSQDGNGLTLRGGQSENIGFDVTAGQTLTVSGRNGLVLVGDQNLFLANSGAAGRITASATLSGNGAGIQITTGAGVGGSLGNVTLTGFATGIAATGASQLLTVEGGAITAAGTGISLSSTGSSSLLSQAAIIAPTGIQLSPTTGASIVTSGAGTIDSTASGVGTGIRVNTTGSGLIDINVGAAIGGNTAFDDGISVIGTNPSTAYVNVHTAADITAVTGATSNYGIYVQAYNSYANRGTIDIGANVTGGDGIYTQGGVYDFVVHDGATVTAGAVNGAGITSGNSTSTLVNAGNVQATNVGGDGLYIYGMGSITNQATGSILGADNGIYLVNSTRLNNAGVIAGGTGAGVFGAGSNITNSGTISGNYGFYTTRNPFSLNNSGTISGAVSAIAQAADSNLTVMTNTGTINTTGGPDSSSAITLNSTSANANSNIVNSGVIAGGVSGYGVSNGSAGVFYLNNRSGGTISGAQGSLLLSGSAAQTVNLDFGSTTNGDIVSYGSGAVTLTIAGDLNGNYDGAAGTGVENLTLAATGAMQGATLGTAADTFTFQGGTVGGTVSGGAGVDTFTSDLGIGNRATLNMSNLTSFEINNHRSGTLTLTGSGNPLGGWNVTSGAAVVLAGTINSASTYAFSINGNTAGSDIQILSSGSITGAEGLFFNGVTNAGFSNQGNVLVTYGPAVQTNGATVMINMGSLVSSGSDAIFTGVGVASLANSGQVLGSSTSFGLNASFGATVNNLAGGSISGGAGGIRSGGSGIGGLLTISNASGASIAGNSAIATTGLSALNLANSGYVVGSVQGIGASGSGGVSIVNNASGIIGTGTITGNTYFAGGTGDAVDLINGAITNNGWIEGASTGIAASNDLTLTNRGTIMAHGSGSSAVAVAGLANVLNTGSIFSFGTSAITANGGTVTNAASGALTSSLGTAVVFNAGGTFNNYGWASDVRAGGSSTINLFAGSTTGNITLGAGDDTLAIYSGTAAGTAPISDANGNIIVQNSGLLAPARLGSVDMGAGVNTLLLRGTGNGMSSGGVAGIFSLATLTGASILTKADSGTWTLTGSAMTPGLTINAGIGGTPGASGLLIFDGTTGLAGTINLNGATIRATTAGAFGTATINAIDPTIQFGASGTYANNISLQSVAPASDPTTLQTYGNGITVTLTGAITEATAGQPLVFTGTDIYGFPNFGTFELTNAANNWTGTTTINNVITLRGTSDSISGSSILDNGVLAYNQANSGTVEQNISGIGLVSISGFGANTLTFSGNNNQGQGFSVLDSSGVAFTGSNVTNNYSAVRLAGGGRLDVSASGSLFSNLNNAVIASASGSVITNAGTLRSATYAAIYAGSSASNTTVINSGTITGPTSGTTLTPALSLTGENSSVTNLAGGMIVGQRGVYLSGINNFIDNAGTITGTYDNAISVLNGGVVHNLAGGVLNANGTSDAWGIFAASTAGNTVNISNAGAINASSGIVTQSAVGPALISNSGSVNSGEAAVWAYSGTIDLNNSGSILSTGSTGILSQAGGTIINSGSINAGQYGISVGAASNITNQAGGTITGNSGAIALAGTDLINATLDQQSVANGNILSVGSGARDITVNGALNGIYDASTAQGSTTLTLGEAGSINGARFGAGDDLFITHGGIATGAYSGGGGNDRLLADIAAGNAGGLDLSGVDSFEIFEKSGLGEFTLSGTSTASPLLILAGNGNGPAGTLVFDGTTTLTSDIIVDGAVIRADAAGAFGVGTITAISPIIQYAASGTYANDIHLAVPGDSSLSPNRLEALNGAVVSLTGAIVQDASAGPQYVTIGGNGATRLTNTNNLWTGVTAIESGATLLGASDTISGSSIVNNGELDYVQAYGGTVTQNVSGTGRIGVGGLAAGEALTFSGNLTNGGIDLVDGSHIALSGVNATSGMGVNVSGANATVDIVAGGTLSSNAAPAIQSSAANTTISNAGVLAGGTATNSAAGIGVVFAANSSGTFTNQSSGTVSGGTASILADTDNEVRIDLQQGSSANGSIISIGAGARNVNVSGTLNGTYDAHDGTGADTVVLAATGTTGAIDLGGGDDRLTLRSDAVTGTIAGGSGVDTLSFDIAGSATFDAGRFSGFEDRSMDSSGTLTLMGNDAMAADFQVNRGTLALSGGSALNDSAALVTAAGTTVRLLDSNEQVRTISGAGAIELGTNALILGGDDDSIYSGVISGSGSLAKFGTGTLVLSGANSFTGLTQISGGTVRLGADNVIADSSVVFVDQGATFDLANHRETVGGLGGAGSVLLGSGGLTINQAGTTQFDGAITGSGSLTLAGAGQFILAGNSTFTGPVNVNGGTLSVNGSIAAAMSVRAGAVFGGNGTIGSLSMLSGGTLSPGGMPGASLGHLTVHGDLNFAAGSIYSVNVTPMASDSVSVTGNVTIAGGTVQVLADGTAYSPITRYTILTAGGTVSGKFSDVTSNLAFLTPTLQYTPTGVLLNLRRNDIDFQQVASGGNQSAVAGALQSLGSGSLYDAILSQSADGARQAYNALSGEVYASSAAALLSDRKRLQDAMCSNQLRQDGLSFWADAGRGWGSFDSSNRGSASASTDTHDLLNGLNLRRGPFAATVAGGRIADRLEIGSRSSEAKSRSWILGGQLSYGTATGPQALIGGNYDWHKVRTTRSINFPGFADTVTSRRDGRGYHLFGELGYAVVAKAITAEPFVGLQRDRLALDATSETGGMSALDVRSRTFGLTTTDIGLKLSTTANFGWARFTPRATVGWQHVTGGRVGHMIAGFHAGGSDFATAGAALSKDAAVAGMDLNFDLKGAKIVASYAGVLGGSSDQQTAKLGFQIRF